MSRWMSGSSVCCFSSGILMRRTWRVAMVFLALAAPVQGQVVTSQYDNGRSGATLNEKILTPENVNSKQFGKLGAFQVDGAVYAQPLFLPGVEVPGKGAHNVLFVATEHDTVYAFDAERPGDAPLWQVSLLDKQQGATPVATRDVQCPFIQPEVGITSTPVIDRKSGTLYVLARSKVSRAFGTNEYFQHLHALAITTGVEKFGGPKLITASVPGRAKDAVNGEVRFNALRENPRASLLLVDGAVLLTWASSCDIEPYHGWVMAYDAETLAQKAVLNVTPDGREGGIWESDTGPGVDASGNIFVPTGNGTFDVDSGGRDYGDSLLKLGLEKASIVIRDSFTPYDQAAMNEDDADLGSSGPLLLPDQPGAHRHLLLQPTKAGMLYMIDRDQLGKFHKDGNAIVQEMKLAGSGYGAMAYWNRHVFFAANDDFLRDFELDNGTIRPHKSANVRFMNPGATPTISSNGVANGIVWAVATKTWDGHDQPAILYAFDAKDVGRTLYTSEENSARDRAGLATRFVIPVVVNGRVYVGVRAEVEVYGLLK